MNSLLATNPGAPSSRAQRAKVGNRAKLDVFPSRHPQHRHPERTLSTAKGKSKDPDALNITKAV